MVGVVGIDAVDSEVDKAFHLIHFVHRPNVNTNVLTLRFANELRRHDLEASETRRHLERLCGAPIEVS